MHCILGKYIINRIIFVLINIMKTFFALIALAAAAQPVEEETHLMTIAEALENINRPPSQRKSSKSRR